MYLQFEYSEWGLLHMDIEHECIENLSIKRGCITNLSIDQFLNEYVDPFREI